MIPLPAPSLAPLPSDPEVIVVGAGAAGIGAARRLLAAGLSVAVLEARNRVGGRALTVSLRGHPVDLGAHWLHFGAANPLIRLGEARGEPMRRAPVEGHLVRRGRFDRRGRQSLGAAFGRAEGAIARAAGRETDSQAAAALPFLGPWREPVATVHGLVSGRPLREVSARDFSSMNYGENRFIAGGYGAYLARLAAGLPVRLGAAVTWVEWSGRAVTAETAAGRLSARAAIVTLPVAVLAGGALRFSPALPEGVAAALARFAPGIYEHVVLHWPSSPFRGADRLATLTGAHRHPPGLLTRIDGTPFHYFELDQPLAASLDGRDRDAPARLARAILAEQFGAAAIRDLAVPAASDWRHDPWARSSWAVVPPGGHGLREALRAPVEGRLWLAGEALSAAQWGTVGGAWAEGERAAEEVIARLR